MAPSSERLIGNLNTYTYRNQQKPRQSKLDPKTGQPYVRKIDESEDEDIVEKPAPLWFKEAAKAQEKELNPHPEARERRKQVRECLP